MWSIGHKGSYISDFPIFYQILKIENMAAGSSKLYIQLHLKKIIKSNDLNRPGEWGVYSITEFSPLVL